MKSKMGITSVAGLARKYITMGVKVNAGARKWMAENPV